MRNRFGQFWQTVDRGACVVANLRIFCRRLEVEISFLGETTSRVCVRCGGFANFLLLCSVGVCRHVRRGETLKCRLKVITGASDGGVSCWNELELEAFFCAAGQ